jgi:nitroimidazol reductase NimA-like FMN-containing flavoprotein (pyridoxamine 5'-phosphate oxidase superfamily)
MVIREITREECLRLLPAARLARLACVHENQPYIIPVYLTYHQSPGGEPCFYGFTTKGQKIEWMRANPLVCVEVEQVVAYDQWLSVIATGRYEELPRVPAIESGRLPEQSESRQQEHSDKDGCDNEAWRFLKDNPMWQEPGSTAWAVPAHRGSAEKLIPVFYRIRIDRVTGHESTRNGKDAISSAAEAPLSLADPAGNGLPGSLLAGSNHRT